MGKYSRRTLHHKEEKDGEVKKLRNANRRLASDNRKLIAENESMRQALHENFDFLKGVTDEFTMEELIQAAKDKKKLKEVKEQKEECSKKWKCKLCDGLMCFLHLPRMDGEWYMRKCNNPKCTNKTRAKRLEENTDRFGEVKKK